MSSKGKGKSTKTKKHLIASKGIKEDKDVIYSQEQKPQGSLTTEGSPSRKSKEISSYFPVSTDSASSSAVVKQTQATDEVHEGLQTSDTLIVEEISSENTEDKTEKGAQKRPVQSVHGVLAEKAASQVLGPEDKSPDQGQEKVDKVRKAAEGVASRKGKRRSKKKQETSKQTEITKHFPVRRSTRRCKSVLEDEKKRKMEEAILAGREEGVEVKEVEDKGRGVFTSRPFCSEEFVCEYAGELIDIKTAQEREEFYQGNPEYGCYMYYFTFKNKKYCVDATKETGRLGRLLNHSKCGNCATRLVSIRDRPYLILETKTDIKAGEELLYDYGERSRDIVASHPWLET